ncbi:hypothetical protein [Pollutimonas sp. M17]|uniref:hypothetical protein n=1 Tax=Pollutimonas sp. M17 TaxID=2962065 RepID=UPI0021F4061D|nr:hypothetical protein [Pollutimonas sp. M17]UYO95040.1 hypothetical protein OEG81_06955 [Pollutimonas sp. M17]
MKNAPDRKAIESAKDQGHSNTRNNFKGTDNPRHLRTLQALLKRPLPRETLDKVAGCSNGPDLVAELRRRGLKVPCERIRFIDRDGKLCSPGVYKLLSTDRTLIYRWLAQGRRVA